MKTWIKNAMRRFAKPPHKRAARILGYALSVGASDVWKAASAVWAARLTLQERMDLAFATLCALDPEDAHQVAVDALRRLNPEGAGPPSPPLDGDIDEARFWTSRASKRELKTYALASYDAMEPADQAEFRDHVMDREAAE